EPSLEKRIDAFQPPKSDINALILDYLTREGYVDAASKFCHEADLPYQHSLEEVKTRRRIQQAIHSGNIQEAIKSLNDIAPHILDNNAEIYFSLLRLQLIEMIRDCSAKGEDPGCYLPAVNFAQQNLAGRAVENPELLESLEKAMSLIVFPRSELTHELSALLDPKLRQDVANSVNKAILEYQELQGESAVRYLLKMRNWTVEKAEMSGISLDPSLELSMEAL
ncbi:hypothetical protein TD95_003002, partial [Thielaviopsis punctulata]